MPMISPFQQAFRQGFDLGDYGFPSRQQYMSPNEEESLLSQLGGYARGGLGFVADVLDTPGAFVRGLIAGENPLPGIFDVSKRTSTEDLTGTDDFISNLAAGIVTDPLTYLTFGGSALGKAGQVAKAANLLDDATRIAGAGKRVSRLTTSLDDLIRGAADPIAAEAAAGRAAEGMGLNLADIAGEKLGGMVGVGMPFQEPLAAFGTGPTAQKIAGGLDWFGEKALYSKPGRWASQLFDPGVRGTQTEEVQRALRDRAGDFAAGRQEAIGAVSEPLTRLREAGMLDDQTASDIVRGIEGLVTPTNPAVRGVADDIGQALYDLPMRQHDLGLPSNIHTDPAYQAAALQAAGPGDMLMPGGSGRTPYFPHVLSDTSARGQMGRRGRPAIDTLDPFQQRRDISGIAGGREQIRQIVQDPEIYNAATPADALATLQRKYGTLFVGPDAEATQKHLADSIRSLQPDQQAAGMFGNHPLVDAQSRLIAASEARGAANTIYDVLAKNAIDPATLPPGSATTKISDVLQKAGLNAGTDQWGAIKQFGERMPGGPGAGVVDFHVPSDLAADVGRLMKGFSAPDEVMDIVKGLDSFLNLFKVGVLAWPARHVRDFVSGQWNNVVSGTWSKPSLDATYQMLKGGAIEGAEHYPIVRDLLTQRGLAATPENATNIVRELVMEQELLKPFSGKQGDVIGAVGGMTRGGIDDLLGTMPGGRPAPSMAEIIGSAVPRNLEQVNPLNVRGVGGRMETLNSWAKASENAGWVTDAMNRVAPFVEQLSQGVDPRSAAMKVLASQVDYSAKAFTPFERAYLKRLFPFYSFTKGMVPFVFRQLAERPGGRLAQTIRATNELSGNNDWLPDWVANTAAVPLGEEENGSQRFLTGLGLMHEDVLGLVRPGVDTFHTLQNVGQELLGRSNPLIKGPVEFTAGRQFYTGRELEDLDSSIGRTIQNVAGTEYPPEIPILLDQILSNSPAARVVSTFRTATDPRKEWWAKLVNLGTGARLTDVNMDTQRSVQSRQILEDILRSDPAVRSFEHLYVRPEDMARLSPDEQLAMQLYQTLGRQAQATARARKQQPSVYDMLAP